MVDFNPFGELLKGITPSPELRRILDMPRRDPEAIGSAIAGPLTVALRVPGSPEPPPGIPAALRWYQALALAEAHDFRGALIPLPVGAGKTLISALLGTVLASARPLVIVPAKLRDKTLRDFEALRPYWRLPVSIQVISYELIGRRPDLLLQIGPDSIVCDEAYRLKNTKSGRKRRIWRYMQHYPNTPFVCLTGTVQKKGFKDWWHIQRACLPEALAVLPHDWQEMTEWDQALAPNLTMRRPLGALSRLCGPQGGGVDEVRTAYGERFRMTPGIITCPGGSCDASIEFTVERVKHPEIERYVEDMRTTWETPNGVPFTEASQLWAHARELANGYVLIWRVPGPPEWMQARRDAAAFVREILKHSRTLDTELQVYQKHGATAPELVRWRQIRPTFTPEPIAHWFTHDIVDLAVARARKDNSLIWIEHVTAGEMIAARHGLPYFGRGGVCATHGSIMDYAGGPAVASIQAVGEGFNLQDRWNSCIVLNAPPGCVEYEQAIGRFHRQGQQADVVRVTQLCVVQEQIDGFRKAVEQARAAQQTDSQAKKLCLADIVYK